MNLESLRRIAENWLSMYMYIYVKEDKLLIQ